MTNIVSRFCCEFLHNKLRSAYDQPGSNYQKCEWMDTNVGAVAYQKMDELETALFLSENGECVICLDDIPIDDFILLSPCGHIFHRSCLNFWINKAGRRPVCPICERPCTVRPKYFL